MFENRMVRKIFVPKREKVAVGLRRLKMGGIINCTIHQILLVCNRHGRPEKCLKYFGWKT